MGMSEIVHTCADNALGDPDCEACRAKRRGLDTPPRDAEADLAVCEGASKGPWEADTVDPSDCVVWGPPISGSTMPLFLGNVGADRVQRTATAFDFDAANAAFIALSRTALPHWIRRAQRAEAEVERLKARIQELEDDAADAAAEARWHDGD